MLWRWALRDLRRSWRSALFFVLNLSLGLAGFISIEAYKGALYDHLQSNRRQILGGDISVSARRELDEKESRVVADSLGSADSSIVYDFFAMVTTDKGSRLVLAKAIDQNYPLYGEVTLEDGSHLKLDSDGFWIYPELAKQLQLNVSDKVKIGQLTLIVRGLVKKDTAQTFKSAGFAPHVFFNRARLSESGLLQFGSTFSFLKLFRLPIGTDIAELEKTLEAKISDPAVSIETADQAGGNSAKQMAYLSDFLGLVALVGLFLASIGGAYLWRLFLQRKTKDVAILRALGVSGGSAVLVFVIEAALLGISAVIPSALVAQLIFPLLNQLLSTLTPFDLKPFIGGRALLAGVTLSIGTSLLIALPLLLKLQTVKPSRLFSEEKFNPDLKVDRAWSLIPAILLLWLLAVGQASSLKIGSLFTGTLAGMILVLAIVGWLCLKGLESIKSGPWDLRHGLRSTARRPVASLSVFIALGLGSLLLNILPQIKVSLQKEFTVEGPSKLPSFFMFDIQDEQLPIVLEAAKTHGATLAHQSPLIRARILKVNDKNYERATTDGAFRTREEEQDARFRNRGVNLSYRSEFSETESLYTGKPFSGPWTANSGQIPEVSVEYAYAERMGLKIGDKLLFDVQGVEIPAQIVNLRQVKWTSFQPNFFMTIQSGVLEEAPKSWIVSTSRLLPEVKESFERDLTSKLTNVSIIDVERTVNEVLQMMDQMSWSLEFMAALAVLTGAVVLFSISRTQARSRRAELNLLKILGADSSNIRRYMLSEFGVLVGLASLVGGLLCLVVSGILLRKVFDLSFSADPRWILGSFLAITFLGLVVAERASASVIHEKPNDVFRESGS